MAETIITRGVVLREQPTGERDRLVTILTEDIGVIRAFVNGAKSAKSKTASSTDLLCCSKFTISRSNSNVFTVREASVIKLFFSLRQDIVLLSLAQYIGEIAVELSPREAEAAEQLRLVLNAFSFLADSKKSPVLIKAASELRLLTLAGYMPSLVACDNCGRYESESMFFDPFNGKLYCSDCEAAVPRQAKKTGLGVITAMRYICFCQPEKVFSFNLPDDSLKALSSLSETYLRNVTARNYKTLDFYKQMTE